MEPVTEDQLEILRCVRRHSVATAEIVAREVLGAPSTTFGRTLKLRAAEQRLAALAAAGLLEQAGEGLQAEFMLSPAGREQLRHAALTQPAVPPDDAA